MKITVFRGVTYCR